MQKKRKAPTSKLQPQSSNDLRPRKSLGQHFLANKHYLRTIVDAADLTSGDTVVEIGPGKGSLTGELLAHGARVIALEKDRRLIPLLQEKFAREIKTEQLKIIEIDALEFNAADYGLLTTNYLLIGNIPYYITGALLQKFLTIEHQPSTLVFLVQKEVAERIARSNPDAAGSGPRPKRRGKESLLSLSVKAYGTPKYIKTVPAGAFSPPPKVDSAILLISNISRSNFTNKAHEERFFELIHAGFAHKRKQLGRNLEPVLGPNYSNVLKNIGIPPTARAEDVPLFKWLELAEAK